MEVEYQGAVVAGELEVAWVHPAPEEEVKYLHRSAARTAQEYQEAPVENLFR